MSSVPPPSALRADHSSTTSTPRRPLHIAAIAARSRFGYGFETVLDALTTGAEAPSTVVEDALARPIEGFDLRTEAGPGSVRTLDRATGIALSALASLCSEGTTVGPETALILGTSMGSVASTIRFTQDGLSGSRPYLVDPSRFPNTVMNFAAGQSAIRHGLTGPNATVIAGAVTGITALRYARRMIGGGQAERVVVGATEELSAERIRLARAIGSATSIPLGEGAAMLLLTPVTEATDGPAVLVTEALTAFASASRPGAGDRSAGALVARASAAGTGTPQAVIAVGADDDLAPLLRQVRATPSPTIELAP
ncbi:beta-ketoacyl synthase N-terminal-like domain-containing protein, partial [Plantibacter sp. CFBP 13570]